AAAETEIVVINAPAGDYAFYCKSPGHRDVGMVGVLLVNVGGTASLADDQEAERVIVAGDVFFDLAAVAIPARTDVIIELRNEGAAPHNFSIDEMDVSVDIAPGETRYVVINAPAGEYEYYCDIPGHREAGMTGTLTVGAPATPATTPEADTGEATVILALDIYFDPRAMEIPADTEVTLELRNEGAAPHNFTIYALEISVDLAPGETKQAVLNAPAGTYEYFCNIPGHREAGMVGTLTVTESPAVLATPVTTEEPALYDGQWGGPTSSQGGFSLTIETNSVTEFYFHYHCPSGAPQGQGVAASWPLDGNNFDIRVDSPEMVIEGEFVSASEVRGTAVIVQSSCFEPVSLSWVGIRLPDALQSTPSTKVEDESTTAVRIVAVDIAFLQIDVHIPAEEDVTIELFNAGSAQHNFTIDELDISVDLVPGETRTVIINAPAGEYEFYCNIPGHREAGMVGTLTAE
ncbi:MAG: cupredoxin domain-containing protein, partial [Thermomicrobiales bacterium]